MALSNLIENAIYGCEALPETAEKHLCFICCHVGRLVLEISNPCGLDTAPDENGWPTSRQEGHGIGTKSILAFAKKYDAEVFCRIEKGIFIVRLLV